MHPISAINYACALVAIYTIYRTSRAPILTRFLKRIIAIQILNTVLQIIETHPDNEDMYSLIAIITNIIGKSFTLALGLVDLKILTLFSSIDEKLSTKTLDLVFYSVIIGFVVFILPNWAGFILYFTNWQYRNECIYYSLYASILFGIQALALITVIYGRTFWNLYNFKRDIPDAAQMGKPLLVLSFAIVFNLSLLFLMPVSQVIYPEWYGETHKVLIALLGNHSFLQLAFFQKAKDMALVKIDGEGEVAAKVKVVMLLEVVQEDMGITNPRNASYAAEELKKTVLFKSGQLL